MRIALFLWMRLIFRPQNHAWRPLLCSLFLSVFATSMVVAQTIQGIVIDAGSGEPIIGATILEKNSDNNGTITDFDGKLNWKHKQKRLYW